MKEVSLKFKTSPLAGINLDLKLGPRQTPQYIPKASYGFVRLRYAMAFPQFEKKYEGMDGAMHYITLGFGVMSRNLKQVK